jgi:SAM-dependent methyltransferase
LYADYIDVNDLIKKYSVEDLCKSAEAYFKRMPDWKPLLSKPFRLPEIQHLLPTVSFMIQGMKLYPGMSILDFGAGPCWASRLLNQLGLKVYSLDCSRTALEIGQKLIRENPVFGKQPPHKLLLFNGRRIELPDGYIDRIFCLDAFHHVPNQKAILLEMGRILKDGGIAAFAEPGPNHSKSPQSQFEMSHFNVIERDIDLDEIFSDAKEANFTDLRVCIGYIYPIVKGLKEYKEFLSDNTLKNIYLESTENRIKNFPIFFLDKGDTTIKDSREGEGLVAEIKTEVKNLVVTPEEPVLLKLEITNNTNKIWLPSGEKIGSVNIGGFLYEQEKGVLKKDSKELRFSLSAENPVSPGEKVISEINLEPLKTGKYRLEIDLVSEHVRWFSFNHSPKAIISINCQ